jgi:hypothetical protein
MDYLLVYLDEDDQKMAALPDNEGVYKNSTEFDEYTEEMTNREVVVLRSEDFYRVMNDPDFDGKYFEAEFEGQYITSSEIHKCIDNIGFEKFFTTIINEHIKSLEEEEEE